MNIFRNYINRFFRESFSHLELSMFDKKRITYITLLALNMILVFYARKLYLDAQYGCDEPMYVKLALWPFSQSHPMWSPIYIDMLHPFLAFFGEHLGFKIFRFILQFGATISFFLFISRYTYQWAAFILSIFLQFNLVFCCSQNLPVLELFWLCSCFLLIINFPHYLGVGWGLMILGSLVRGEILFMGMLLLLIILVTNFRLIFNRKFIVGACAPLLLFVSIIYLHGGSLSDYREKSLYHGNLGIVWFLRATMHEMGYFSKYPYAFGETPDSVLNEVFLKHFGREFRELSYANDNNLMYTLYKANPELVKTHLLKTFRDLPIKIVDALRINIPLALYMDKSIQWTTVSGLFAWQTLLLCTIPLLATGRLKKKDSNEPARNKAPLYKHFLPFLPLIGFVPWLLTYPQPHYIFPIIITYLATIAIACNYCVHIFPKVIERLRKA